MIRHMGNITFWVVCNNHINLLYREWLRVAGFIPTPFTHPPLIKSLHWNGIVEWSTVDPRFIFLGYGQLK